MIFRDHAGTAAPYPITPRQRDALHFIAGFVEAHGRAPSCREIATALGLAARSGALRLVRGLVERGHLQPAHYGQVSCRTRYPVTVPRGPDLAPLLAVPGPWWGR